MKTSKSQWYIILLIVITIFSTKQNSSGKTAVSEADDSLLGAAGKMNITPETPLRMSGYGDRTEPFTGIHDSLYASALVFSNGQTKAAFITADLIGFSHSIYNEIVEMIEKESGIPGKNIMLSAVHNHGGPVVANGDQTTEEGKYANELKQKIVALVKDVSKNLQPVKIGYGNGTYNMNNNRRAPMPDGSIWLGRNPDGSCDQTVAIVRMDDRNDNPLAVFVNWPCHGVVGNSKITSIHGDWPGSTARYLENTLGENVIVGVTAGASGDINPLYHSDNFEEIDATGVLLGKEVAKVFKNIKTSADGTIKCNNKTIVAKGKKRQEYRKPNQQLEPDKDIDINLSVLKIGNVVFAGISGELFNEIGMDIKNESAIDNTIVVTHCNGSSGYLCTDKSYPEGGYEINVTRTMPGTEALIRDNVLEMIQIVSK